MNIPTANESMIEVLYFMRSYLKVLVRNDFTSQYEIWISIPKPQDSVEDYVFSFDDEVLWTLYFKYESTI